MNLKEKKDLLVGAGVVVLGLALAYRAKKKGKIVPVIGRFIPSGGGMSSANGTESYSNVGGKPYSITCAEDTKYAGTTFYEQGDRIHLLYNGDVKGWQDYICKNGKPIDYGVAGSGRPNLMNRRLGRVDRLVRNGRVKRYAIK